MLSEDGQLTLSPDAIPTIIPVTVEDQVMQRSPRTQEVWATAGSVNVPVWTLTRACPLISARRRLR